MKTYLKLLVLEGWLFIAVFQIHAQGYIIPNGVSYAGPFLGSGYGINVVHNPTNFASTGFILDPLGKTPPTIYTNTFRFDSIVDVPTVAPYHQHGPRGSYADPDFKGSDIFIVMNSIGKALGLKFDAFGGKLMRRDDNSVVARDRDAVAKILLNPDATADDLNSVKQMLHALRYDPQRDPKLAQARADAARGLISLPGDLP